MPVRLARDHEPRVGGHLAEQVHVDTISNLLARVPKASQASKDQQQMATFNCIRSKKHQLSSY